MKLEDLLGWLIGLLAAGLAFFTLGVWLLFPVAWVYGHGGLSYPVLVGALVVVVAACLYLAYLVKKLVTALTRKAGRRGE